MFGRMSICVILISFLINFLLITAVLTTSINDDNPQFLTILDEGGKPLSDQAGQNSKFMNLQFAQNQPQLYLRNTQNGEQDNLNNNMRLVYPASSDLSDENNNGFSNVRQLQQPQLNLDDGRLNNMKVLYLPHTYFLGRTVNNLNAFSKSDHQLQTDPNNNVNSLQQLQLDTNNNVNGFSNMEYVAGPQSDLNSLKYDRLNNMQTIPSRSSYYLNNIYNNANGFSNMRDPQQQQSDVNNNVNGFSIIEQVQQPQSDNNVNRFSSAGQLQQIQLDTNNNGNGYSTIEQLQQPISNNVQLNQPALYGSNNLNGIYTMEQLQQSDNYNSVNGIPNIEYPYPLQSQVISSEYNGLNNIGTVSTPNPYSRNEIFNNVNGLSNVEQQSQPQSDVGRSEYDRLNDIKIIYPSNSYSRDQYNNEINTYIRQQQQPQSHSSSLVSGDYYILLYVPQLNLHSTPSTKLYNSDQHNMATSSQSFNRKILNQQKTNLIRQIPSTSDKYVINPSQWGSVYQNNVVNDPNVDVVSHTKTSHKPIPAIQTIKILYEAQLNGNQKVNQEDALTEFVINRNGLNRNLVPITNDRKTLINCITPQSGIGTFGPLQLRNMKPTDKQEPNVANSQISQQDTKAISPARSTAYSNNVNGQQPKPQSNANTLRSDNLNRNTQLKGTNSLQNQNLDSAVAKDESSKKNQEKQDSNTNLASATARDSKQENSKSDSVKTRSMSIQQDNENKQQDTKSTQQAPKLVKLNSKQDESQPDSVKTRSTSIQQDSENKQQDTKSTQQDPKLVKLNFKQDESKSDSVKTMSTSIQQDNENKQQDIKSVQQDPDLVKLNTKHDQSTSDAVKTRSTSIQQDSENKQQDTKSTQQDPNLAQSAQRDLEEQEANTTTEFAKRNIDERVPNSNFDTAGSEQSKSENKQQDTKSEAAQISMRNTKNLDNTEPNEGKQRNN